MAIPIIHPSFKPRPRLAVSLLLRTSFKWSEPGPLQPLGLVGSQLHHDMCYMYVLYTHFIYQIICTLLDRYTLYIHYDMYIYIYTHTCFKFIKYQHQGSYQSYQTCESCIVSKVIVSCVISRGSCLNDLPRRHDHLAILQGAATLPRKIASADRRWWIGNWAMKHIAWFFLIHLLGLILRRSEDKPIS